MEGLRNLKDTARESNSFGTAHSRSSYTLAIAVLCALGVTIATSGAFLLLRKRHVEQVKGQQLLPQATPAVSVAPPEVQVYVDDAMIKGLQTVIGGTIHNISNQPLADLSVELELKRRSDGISELRSIAVEPGVLAPDQRGRYALNVLARDYSGARLLRVKSGRRSTDVGFKAASGAKRPPEPPAQPQQKIIIKTPTPRPKGDDFINTPDTPTKIH